jgi:hypothetical protein
MAGPHRIEPLPVLPLRDDHVDPRAVAISSSTALAQLEADVLEEPHRTAAMKIAQLGWNRPALTP